MKPEVKKLVRRYGIPIDLVILATGVALLSPTIGGIAVVLIYLFAVTASTLKLGWRSGLTAIAAAVLMMLFGFGDQVGGSHELSLIALGLAVVGTDEWRRRGFVNPATLPEVREFGATATAQWESLRARLVHAVQDLREDAGDRWGRLVSRVASAQRQLRTTADAQWMQLRSRVVKQLEARKRRVAPVAEPVRFPEIAEAPRPMTVSPAVEPAPVPIAPPPPEIVAPAPREVLFEATAPLAPAPAEPPPVEEPPAPAVTARVPEEDRESLRREKEAMERQLDEQRQEVEEHMQRQRDELERRLEDNRQMLERAEAERAERERVDAERAAAVRTAAQRLAAERQERQKLEREREALARKLEEERRKLEEERQTLERAVAERTEQAKREAEKTLEERLVAERASMQRKYDEQLRSELEKAAARSSAGPAAAPAAVPEQRGIFSAVMSWLKTPQHSRPVVNLNTKKVATNATMPKRSVTPAPTGTARPARPSSSRERRPRILMLERRRQMADTMAPKLKAQGVDVEIVERWIDAVDELFRFRPDAIFVDAETPDFPRVHQSLMEQSPRLPMFVTTGSYGALPNLPRAAAVMRPYAADAIAKLARDAMTNPQPFLERQKVRQGPTPSPSAVVATPAPGPAGPRPTTPPPRSAPSPFGGSSQRSTPPTPSVSGPRPAPMPPPSSPSARPMPVPSLPASGPRPVPTPVSEPIAFKTPKDRYSVVCFNCGVAFDATEAEWCTCLASERTLICTNCLACFCKAPPSYKEKFWLEAPPRMLERKAAELRKQMTGLVANPPPEKVRRPLVMLVEDDEDIQVIVQRVCANLGYGFVFASNGQEGLNLARLYKPNLILSDAFMPKLDGREMCRLLKEEGSLPDCTMIVMTGLYTDTKYKNEALLRFHIDDYLTKPVLITDLINVLQKNLEGLTGTPPQQNLYELHRKGIEEADASAAAEDAEAGEATQPAALTSRAEPSTYDVCCFTCGQVFDAMHAEWCHDTGRDQTLVCPHCSNCFCKAPAAYKERFWMDAPTSLFERKMISSRRSVAKSNPSPMEVTRPLILLVEEDEDIHLIVKTVVTTMGYGFIVASNGQEGLAMAREYSPDLIISDASMPKLDGREMCRLLKEDAATARIKAIIMTGMYADPKYRNEALSHFKVDDYVAKPVAVNDLIKVIKKYLPQDVQQTM